MNERIKLLAIKANFLNKDEESIEYFAELIVRECSDLLRQRDARIEPADYLYLLKEFGL